MEVITFICNVIVGIVAVAITLSLMYFLVVVGKFILEWIEEQVKYYEVMRNASPKKIEKPTLLTRIGDVYIGLVVIFWVILGVLFFYYIGLQVNR